MLDNFQTTFSEVLKILSRNEKLRIKDDSLLSLRNGQVITAVGDVSSFLLKQKSTLKNQLIGLESIKVLIDNLTKDDALIRLNHIGFCYKVDSQLLEKERLLGYVSDSNMNLYIEPSIDDGVWFFVGNTDNWQDMMLEMLPVEKTEDKWQDYWLPHIQIDIDTTLSEEEINRYVQTAFGETVKPFSIAIDGVVYIVRNRLGTIDGVNIVIDLATKSRNVKYQRLGILKKVDD